MPASPAPLLPPHARPFLQAVRQVAFANPFDGSRAAAEKLALGDAFEAPGDDAFADPNLPRIAARLRPLLDAVRGALATGAAPTDADRSLYVDACLHLLHATWAARLQRFAAGDAGEALGAAYADFLADHERFFDGRGPDLRPPPAEHVFACAFQLGRALGHIGRIVGASKPAAALRAATWRAIFTHDLRRHLRSCARRPNDAATLLTGETGTGKELVAEAIGRSAFAPFDPRARRFVSDPGAGFRVVHIAALAESLLESELFGHERGAFTGAVKERRGLLDAGGPNDVVFFDEIGELGMRAQVALLRVLDGHGFRRVGDTAEQVFTARVVTATHRDLGERIRQQAFRLDLYERLAAVQIRAPALRERLAAAPGERRELVRSFAAREVDAEDVEALTDQVEAFLDAHLPGYPWPGNVRELKRCVESVCVTGTFVPLGPAASASGEGEEDPVRSIRAMTLSAEEVMRRYTSMVFEKSGRRQEEAARVLRVNRKTVAKRLDPAWLSRRARR